MSLIQSRLLIRGLLILIAATFTGCAGVYGQPYGIGGYGNRSYGFGAYGNQGPNYGRQSYGYPAQGYGYYPSASYSTYSYPAYYSHHGHDDDGGHERHYERDHDRD